MGLVVHVRVIGGSLYEVHLELHHIVFGLLLQLLLHQLELLHVRIARMQHALQLPHNSSHCFLLLPPFRALPLWIIVLVHLSNSARQFLLLVVHHVYLHVLRILGCLDGVEQVINAALRHHHAHTRRVHHVGRARCHLQRRIDVPNFPVEARAFLGRAIVPQRPQWLRGWPIEMIRQESGFSIVAAQGSPCDHPVFLFHFPLI
mmetsp:Transcript_12401/g.24938  ORF Transcript_12401/g.24938 Transcript_12401/m.24938 type:complete len:203 (-) Transcript_12401:589-1197(-)